MKRPDLDKSDIIFALLMAASITVTIFLAVFGIGRM